ncbi:MAG TPA: VacJ family lipoprotein [Nitrosospira sp.]|jgi:phospholipid-binding lipoprotein MlaA|nr:VacJ family lipoprotein [Nitrosospira sp.]
MKDSHKRLIPPLLCALLLAGCATTRSPVQDNAETDPIDPYEHLNRKSYDLTDVLDRKILEPVAKVYMDYVPLPMQRSIGYFYDNLGYPNVILNDFLQGKVRQGFGDTLRFVVNSTIGVAGLFDVASPMGLPQHDEDFGQTLGAWGVDATTYIFVPLLGPSSNRDISGIPFSAATSVLLWTGIYLVGAPVTMPLGALDAIQTRARLTGPMQLRDEAALDPYLFVRDSYLQQRKHLIYDGDPPQGSYDDFKEIESPVRPQS